MKRDMRRGLRRDSQRGSRRHQAGEHTGTAPSPTTIKNINVFAAKMRVGATCPTRRTNKINPLHHSAPTMVP